MYRIIKYFRLSLSSAPFNVLSSLFLILIMTLAVMVFNRAIGYIRYYRAMSEAILNADIDDAILYINFEKQLTDSAEDLYKQNREIEKMEGISGAGQEIYLDFKIMDESQGQKEILGGLSVYDKTIAETIRFPLEKGSQFLEVKDLPEDVYPIIVGKNELNMFPYGITKTIRLLPSYDIFNPLSPEDAEWSQEIKVQTVGVIRGNMPAITLSSGSSSGGYDTMTISGSTIFTDNNRVYLYMPDLGTVARYGCVVYKRILKVKEGYDPRVIAKQLVTSGYIGATPMVNLQNKLREYFRADISKYIIDLVIFTSISVIAIGGFNVLLQRWQRRYLSVLYMCGASWKVCMLTDILRGIIVISFPGAIAMLIEWLRYWFSIYNPGFRWIMSLLERLNLSEKALHDVSMFFVKNTISTGSKSSFYDVGLVIDNLTFLYSFLLIVGIHFLSTAWFHISMMRTRPTDVIRQWQ